MFAEIYRCKMCGKRVEEKCVEDIIADTELLKIRTIKRHFCEAGSMGIMEFIGFKRIDK